MGKIFNNLMDNSHIYITLKCTNLFLFLDGPNSENIENENQASFSLEFRPQAESQSPTLSMLTDNLSFILDNLSDELPIETENVDSEKPPITLGKEKINYKICINK